MDHYHNRLTFDSLSHSLFRGTSNYDTPENHVYNASLSPTQRLQHLLTPLIKDCVDELKGWEDKRKQNLDQWW